MCVCVCVCVFSLADPLLGHRCWSVCVCVLCVCMCVSSLAGPLLSGRCGPCVCVFTGWTLVGL